MAAQFVHGKLYTYLALTSSKGKEVAKPEKEMYLLDISKANQIFDYLIKDKQIKFSKGHKILSAKEIKGKKYCKWHYSWTYTTNNCTAFKNVVQNVLKEGRLTLAEKGDMTVDTNPFGLSMNMVLVPIIHKE